MVYNYEEIGVGMTIRIGNYKYRIELTRHWGWRIFRISENVWDLNSPTRISCIRAGLFILQKYPCFTVDQLNEMMGDWDSPKRQGLIEKNAWRD